MRTACFFFAVLLVLAIPFLGNQNTTASSDDFPNTIVTPFLPFTPWRDVKPCGLYFDENEVAARAVECFNTKAAHTEIAIQLPRCFVITKESPDVRYYKPRDFNYISAEAIPFSKILGFYESQYGAYNIFIVENKMAADVYFHELGHFMDELVYGDGDGAHISPYFQVCSVPHY